MREIKFRAWWQNDNWQPAGKMYRVAGFHNISDSGPEEPEVGLSEDVKQVFIVDELPSCVKVNWNNAKDMILMQYTGLKDKNGVEIFEGDLLGLYYGTTHHLYEVKYSDSEAMYTLAAHGRYFSGDFSDLLDKHEWETLDIRYKMSYYALGAIPEDVEVIGNIYENKELLK